MSRFRVTYETARMFPPSFTLTLTAVDEAVARAAAIELQPMFMRRDTTLERAIVEAITEAITEVTPDHQRAAAQKEMPSCT